MTAGLVASDPVWGPVAERFPLKPLVPRAVSFDSLASTIVGQQLSGKAAEGIRRRVWSGLGAENLEPDHLDGHSPDSLRELGLSRAKAASILDLAAHVQRGEVDFARLAEMDDEELVARLTAVRGIGLWTVQMVMIFSLGRPDVMPATDLGVRGGAMLLDALPEMSAPRALLARSAPWSPHRSTAARLLWRLWDARKL